jgi:hypothetical protein
MCPSRSSRSRRNFLRVFGSAVCAGTAGCLGLDQLVQNAVGSGKISVKESDSEYTAESFRAYVDRMRSRYGDHGIWGIQKQTGRENEGRAGTPGTGTGKLSFVGAWSGEWTIGKQKSTSKNEKQRFRIPIDYAAALYRVQGQIDEQGRLVHRIWQWAAAKPEQPDEGHGRTKLVELSVGIALNSGGGLDRYDPRTSSGPNDAPVRIRLSGPGPTEPSCLHPLPTGRIKPSPDTTTGSNGAFGVDWTGGYGATISVAGVCEIQRDPKHEYEFTLSSEMSGTQGTL